VSTRLADLFTGRRLSRARTFLARELTRLSRASTPPPSTGLPAEAASSLPETKPDLDLVEAVFCHREADGVAITYVQGARTVSLWLPRHRAARLIAEIASALT